MFRCFHVPLKVRTFAHVIINLLSNTNYSLMEKQMKIVAVNDLVSRPYNDRQGQPAVMHTRTVLLSDGIDTYAAELVGNMAQGLDPTAYPAGTLVSVVLRFRYQKGQQNNTYFQSVQIDRMAKF